MTNKCKCPITIGVWNWFRDDWLAGYYPADLPEEWRPAYYANDYACVGLPADSWDFQSLSHWKEETGEGFVFWLGCNLRQLSHPDFMTTTNHLGTQLAGLWLEATDVNEEAECINALENFNQVPVYRMHASVPARVPLCQLDAPLQSEILGVYRPEPEDDIRTRRDQLESYAATKGVGDRYLLIDGSPSVVEECRQLISLLGI